MKKSARKTTRKATGRTKKARSAAAPVKATAKKKAVAKKAPAKKKAVAKKTVAKKAVAKKAVAKKAVAKKTASRAKPARKKRASVGKRAASRPEMLGEVEALAALMDSHGLLDVAYEIDADGSKRIHVSRNGGAVQQQVVAAPAPAPAPAVAAPAAAPAPADAPPAPAADEGLVPFTSPMVGTFYRAPSPEAPPFSSVGDVVTADQFVCIIEAMKVMNEIQPEMAGEIVSFEVENGQAVEFGQTLMLIRPR